MLNEVERCGPDKGWKLPAPDVHPPFVNHPAASGVDPALAPVVGFREIKTKMRKRYYVFIAIGAFLAYSGLIEPNWIRVRTYDLTIKGLAQDITVVHIADLHTRSFGYREGKTLDIIRQIDPDYVFFTGDLLKGPGRLSVGLAFLSGLQARRGVFVVPGNGDAALHKAIDEGHTPRTFGNWRVLMNEHVDCGDFTVVGLDDPVTCRDDLGAALAGVEATKPVLVLTHFHAKKLLARMAEMHAAVIFSGHTHGGQVGFSPLVSHIPYAHRSKYIAGLYSLNGTYLAVTRGVGTNLFPLRFFCRPEIAVFHLKGA